MDDPRIPPGRPRLSLFDMAIGLGFVIGANLVFALVRWLPDWASIGLAAAVGLVLWYYFVVSRKQ